MAQQQSNMVSYAQFAALTSIGGLISSIVTGSLLPTVVVGIGLFLLFAFFSGISSGAFSSQKPRRRAA
jgi:branched-subunit amino acid transport protein